ncbi:MAG: hypothetical protein WC375_09215 [Methanomassiliicoccales archaeon]|jgi:hypothetical protein
MPFPMCIHLASPIMQSYADQHPLSVRQCAKTGVKCERCGVFNSRSVAE